MGNKGWRCHATMPRQDARVDSADAERGDTHDGTYKAKEDKTDEPTTKQ